MKPPPRGDITRPLEDHEVDRREVEVRQRMELTRTNRSAAYPQFWHRREAEDAGPAGSKCSTVRCALLLFSFEGMKFIVPETEFGL